MRSMPGDGNCAGAPRAVVFRGGPVRTISSSLRKANGPGGFPSSPFIEYADLIADQSGLVKHKMMRVIIASGAVFRIFSIGRKVELRHPLKACRARQTYEGIAGNRPDPSAVRDLEATIDDCAI